MPNAMHAVYLPASSPYRTGSNIVSLSREQPCVVTNNERCAALRGRFTQLQVTLCAEEPTVEQFRHSGPFISVPLHLNWTPYAVIRVCLIWNHWYTFYMKNGNLWVLGTIVVYDAFQTSIQSFSISVWRQEIRLSLFISQLVPNRVHKVCLQANDLDISVTMLSQGVNKCIIFNRHVPEYM
jgi:hypothetical protein